ncbi:unnamed protein product [Pleuronectes platessa]|uniref:Uncharacterized protein n=1 Tax=Pleuronectes platessa TaxID=8262 RepID=A0A9N7Y4S9_PLEPL|nr:unnamed protein product [Pleuronectes platessa]
MGEDLLEQDCPTIFENRSPQGAVSVCICLREREREQHKYRTARRHARRTHPSLQSAEMLAQKSDCDQEKTC